METLWKLASPSLQAARVRYNLRAFKLGMIGVKSIIPILHSVARPCGEKTNGRLCWQESMMQPNWSFYIWLFLVQKKKLSGILRPSFGGFWSSRHVSRGSEHFRAEVKKIGGMMIICFFVFCGFCHAFLVLDNGVPCRLTFVSRSGIAVSRVFQPHWAWVTSTETMHRIFDRQPINQDPDLISANHQSRFHPSLKGVSPEVVSFTSFSTIAMILWRENEKTTIKFHCIMPSSSHHFHWLDSGHRHPMGRADSC